MELTRLEKALVLSGMVTFMKENEVEVNLKPSEAMKIMSVVVEETENTPEEEQDALAVEAYQGAIRKIYDELAKE